MRRVFAVVAGALVALTLMGGVALAHVTIQPNEAPAGSFFRFVVRVPTERDDASTNKVTVRFPDNLAFVGFQPKEGWNRKVTMTKLDEPIEVSGATIDEVVGSVTWSGGEIAPHEFDEFGFSARVPDDAGTLQFEAIQTYSSGEVVRWSGAPDSEEPAPLVNVVDLGAEEGQGQLAVVADLAERVETVETAAATEEDSADQGGTGTATLLGGAGLALGAIALIVALTKRS